MRRPGEVAEEAPSAVEVPFPLETLTPTDNFTPLVAVSYNYPNQQEREIDFMVGPVTTAGFFGAATWLACRPCN